MRRGFGLSPESLPHLGLAGQVGVQHLDYYRSAKGGVLGVIDMSHASASHAPNYAVPVARQPPEIRDLDVGRLAR
jgi:hypothetical protein